MSNLRILKLTHWHSFFRALVTIVNPHQQCFKNSKTKKNNLHFNVKICVGNNVYFHVTSLFLFSLRFKHFSDWQGVSFLFCLLVYILYTEIVFVNLWFPGLCRSHRPLLDLFGSNCSVQNFLINLHFCRCVTELKQTTVHPGSTSRSSLYTPSVFARCIFMVDLYYISLANMLTPIFF